MARAAPQSQRWRQGDSEHVNDGSAAFEPLRDLTPSQTSMTKSPLVSKPSGDRHVTVTRWVMDSVPPPFFTKAGGFSEDEHVDRWQHITWTPPAFVRLDVGAARAGTGAEKGDRSQGFTMRNLNAITPETDKTTHYFWANAINYDLEDESLMEIDRLPSNMLSHRKI